MRMTYLSVIISFGSLLAAAQCIPQASDKAGVQEARKTAEFLDGILRPRFKDEKGRFGISRFLAPSGHSNVIAYGRSPDEVARLQEIQGRGPSFLVYFLRVKHPPGERPEGAGRPEFADRWSSAKEGDLLKLTGSAPEYGSGRSSRETPPSSA